MKFSLITSTIGRTTELEKLLESLDRQTCRSFELIVVDQNSGDRLDPILGRYQDRFSIVHVRSAKGASRGRNVGINHAKGDIVAFPDDDCWYPTDLLSRVACLMDAHPHWDGLCGKPADGARWSQIAKRLSQWNVWRHSIEWTMFLRHDAVEQIGAMNETLGPGAGTPYGAGEGADYLIRALRLGLVLSYEPSIKVHHPAVELPFETHLEKSRKYAMGQGRVLHLRGYPAWYAAYQWTRPLFGAAMGLVQNDPQRSIVALAVMQGIIGGWSSGIQSNPRPTVPRITVPQRPTRAAA